MRKKSLLFIFLAFIFVLSACSIKKETINTKPVVKDVSTTKAEEIKTKVENVINKYFMQEGETVTVSDVKLESDLYKFTVAFSGREATTTSYMTKDGTKLFEGAIDVLALEKTNNGSTPATTLTKSDKPIVELFVMSECPYGTQMEKGIIPVVETLKDKIDFSIKFCDYAMHGEKELKEQLKQYCISKEQPDKYLSYLKCYLTSESGNSEECSKTAKLSSLDACISKTDGEFSIMKNFQDKSTWLSGQYPTFNIFAEDNTKYGVQGSPTLVINGAVLSSERDSKSLLATICNAFINPPEECNTGLSSAIPSPGFGEGTTQNSTDASCN